MSASFATFVDGSRSPRLRFLTGVRSVHSSFGDARVITAGVLGTLMISWAVLAHWETTGSVRAVLHAVPEGVEVVIIESTRSPRARALLAALLRIPEVSLPDGVRPVATVLLHTPSGERVLSIIRTDAARRAGLRGTMVERFTVLGLPPDHPAAAPARAALVLPRSLLQFLRRSPQDALRVLVRAEWVRRRFPLVGVPHRLPDFVGFAIDESEGAMRVRGLLTAMKPPQPLPRPLLRQRPAGTLVLIDGVATSSLLPHDLPPVLDALARSASIEPEFSVLRKAIGDLPGFLLVRESMEQVPDVVVGFRYPPERMTELSGLVRQLLQKRQVAAAAELVRVRVGDRQIRHFRSTRVERAPLQEIAEGSWRTLKVTRNGAVQELTAAVDSEVMLVGTSPDAVRAVTGVVESPRRAGKGEGPRALLDGALLRQQSIFPVVTRGFPAHWQSVLDGLDAVLVESRSAGTDIEIDGTLGWSAREGHLPPP